MTPAALCFAGLLFAALPVNTPDQNLAPTARAMRALRSSVVPVLLPVALAPHIFGPIRSVTVISAGSGGYYVAYSPVRRCAGALSCAFFHVSGYPATMHPRRSYGHDRAVRLADGTRAYYRPWDCSGASCTEAQLTFERAGAMYELDAKVGRENLTALESAYRSLRVVR
jgi:hypothetical protein